VAGAFLFPLKRQLQFTRLGQLFAACALNLEQDDAARLANQTDDGVRASPLAASWMVINLLADLKGVNGSGHPAA
jgi:hypothetical protein